MAAIISFNGGTVDFSDNRMLNNSTQGGKKPLGTILSLFKMKNAHVKHNKIIHNSSHIDYTAARACYVENSIHVSIDSNIICNNDQVSGLYFDHSECVVRGNEIKNNTGYIGAALLAQESNLIIDHNVIAGNVATKSTGGILLTKMKSALVQNNLIYENRAVEKTVGGIGVWSGSNPRMSIEYIDDDIAANRKKSVGDLSTFHKKSVQDSGAVVIINNTIVNNRASSYGGGLLVMDWETYCVNNIIWGNSAGAGAQIWETGTLMQVYHCNIQAGWEDAVNSIDCDPLFVNDALEPFRLDSASQCIDAGVQEIQLNGILIESPESDCYGCERNCSGDNAPDIGASEYQTPVSVVKNMERPVIMAALYGNYPNPFNPTTAIEYALPQPGHVVLTIYNINGQLVETLVNEEQNAGMHTHVWDGLDKVGMSASSGLYMYRLLVSDVATSDILFHQTQKMMLLK